MTKDENTRMAELSTTMLLKLAEAFERLDGIIPQANILGDGAQHELYQAHGRLREVLDAVRDDALTELVRQGEKLGLYDE